MSTTTPIQTTPAPLPVTQVTRREGRFSIAAAAFWAILRRDIAVTLRDFIPFLLQVLLQPSVFPVHLWYRVASNRYRTSRFWRVTATWHRRSDDHHNRHSGCRLATCARPRLCT